MALFCPNVNSKEYKDLAAVQGNAIAHYLWDTYKGEVPQQFYEVKLGGAQTSTAVKAGVSELFDSNPELANAVYEALGVKQVNISFNIESFGKSIDNLDVIKDGKKIGYVQISKNSTSKTLTITGIELKEKGVGKNVYLKLQQQYPDFTIKSDKTALTPDAVNMWDSLVSKKLAIKQGDKQYTLDTKQAQQLYSQYLDTIFPDSKEKDIFYHGLPFIENKDDFFRDSEDDGSVSRDNEVNIRLWNYFFKKRDRARDYGDQQYAVVLNFSADFDSKELAYKASPTFLTNDSAIVIAQGGDEYAVKSKKQIHILGSKQDIQGFERFTKKDVAFRLTSTTTKSTGSANEQRAKKWLEERFPGMAVEFYDTAKQIGDDFVHGYVENASMFLWNEREVGTEYHEAYHIAFRTMLSEAQRDQLYAEALSTYGEPDIAVVSKLAKQFNISTEEARKLALEEKMAEDFREYVLTEQASANTLPGRIKSWFKNLWNWIKALMSDGVSIRQMYSLVESNNMHKSLLSRKVFRNSEKFRGYNTAFMQMPGMGDTLAAHTLDTIKLKFIEHKRTFGKEFKVNQAVGSGTNKGSIANHFLQKIYADKDTLQSLSVAASIEILNAENKFFEVKSNPRSTPEEQAAAKKGLADALAKHNAALALKGETTKREAFKHIYNNWNTIIDKRTGNVITPGWRDMLAIALEDLGLTLRGKDSNNNDVELVEDQIPDEEKEAVENELEAMDSHVAKIYGKSSLEDSPAKRLTGKVKELLSRIPRTEPNLLGYRTYYSREEIYHELLQIFNNKLSYSEMVQALENHVLYKPHLAPVLDFINNLQANEQAMLFNAFALTTTQFILMKKRIVGEGKTAKTYIDVFNPNRKSIVESLVDRWRKAAVSNDPNTPKALFLETEVTDENGNTIKRIVPIEDKVKEAQALIKQLEKRLLNSRDLRKIASLTRPAGEISDVAEMLGDLAFLLNLTPSLSSNNIAARSAMQALINNGLSITVDNTPRTYKDVQMAMYIGNQLKSFVKKMANFEPEGKAGTPEFSAVGKILNYNVTTDFISSNRAAAYEFAALYEPMVNIAGESIVGADGKQKYPTNIQSHMHEIITTIKNYGVTEAGNRAMENYLNDPFIGALGVEKYQSILFRTLKDVPGALEKLMVEDFDGYKDGDLSDDVTLYEDMTKIDSLIIRLNAYLNGGNQKETKIALPIQADRDKYTFLNILNILQLKGLNNTTPIELIKAQIVQDLLRVAEAKKVVDDYLATGNTENIINDYHESKGKFVDPLTGEYLGRAFNESFFQFTAKDENGNQIVTNEALALSNVEDSGVRRMSDVIEDFVLGRLTGPEGNQIEARLTAMANKMMTYFDAQTAKVVELISNRMEDVGIATNDKAIITDTVKGFVITETLMRNEIVKVFRGNRALAKNLVDFYKRMGHLTTPGTKYALVGELANNTYGMMKSFNETTVADLQLNATPEQVERANAAAKSLAEPLYQAANRETNPLVKERLLTQARKVEETYSANKFESTDAQAFISLEMYRGLMMGEGKWDMQIDEPAYKAYKQTGIFAYQEGAVPKGFKAGDRVPILPLKLYYEKLIPVGNTLAVDSQKNSYNVLLKEYTKDFPMLESLRARMESEGQYAGMEPVHVVNFTSGKKLLKRGVHKITGAPNEFANLSVYAADSTGLRRPQTIPDAKDNPTITINRQIKKNMVSNVRNDVSYFYNMGLDSESEVSGQKLKEIYHATIEEKIDRDLAEAKRELGLDKLEAASTPAEIREARLEMLKKIRKLVQSDSIGSDMHSNFLAALNIEFGPDGMPRFTIPLDMPVYGSKYEAVLMSIIENRVFKQSMSGFEAVQVAELGGHAVDNELKFYQIKSENGRQRLFHAELMIREDVARKFGIEPGQSLDSIPEELLRVIGYRIPNQDKASVVMGKIVRFLPANYPKAVVVPGQLIKLMGSDHDVDKLNLLFPEVEKDETSKYGIKKVRPDYTALIQSDDVAKTLKDKKVFTKKALNNIIWDTFEAVGLNENHFFETLTPLDDETLKSEAARVLEAKPELAAAQDWNDMLTEADMMIRNQAGNALRGLYANFVAMRNVLSYGTVTLNEQFAPKIIDNGQVVVYKDYVSINNDGTTTDKTGSLYLSAAVDAAKEDIQYPLNDNVITAPVRMLLLSYLGEYEGRTATNLLNQPIIRKFVEILQDEYNSDTRNFKYAFAKAMSWADQQGSAMVKANPQLAESTSAATAIAIRNLPASEGLVLKGETSLPMLRSELDNLSSSNRNMTEQKIMLNNFWAFYKAGQKLKKLGKRVTPDSMDGMNTVAGILSYKDRAAEFELDRTENPEEETQVMFFGPAGTSNVADQFIGEDSIYGLERGYEKMATTALEIATVLFPTKMSAGFLGAKEQIKSLSNNTELTSDMHRLIDNNLYLMLLMEPDSPLYDHFTGQSAITGTIYSNPKENLYTRLESLKKEFPLLETNKFIMQLDKDFDAEVGYYGIKFDNSFSFSKQEKEAFTSALKTLIYNPQVYLNRPASDKAIGPDGKFLIPEVQEEANKIKGYGIRLALNSILTNGLRKTASSYTELVPVEFFTEKLKHTYDGKEMQTSIKDFLYDVRKRLDATFFTGDRIVNYVQMFGPQKAAGRPIFKRIKTKDTVQIGREVSLKSSEKFVIIPKPVSKGSKQKNLFIGMNTGKTIKNKDGVTLSTYIVLPGFLTSKTVYRLPAITANYQNALTMTSLELTADAKDPVLYGDSRIIQTCG